MPAFSVRAKIHEVAAHFTASDRKVAHAVLADYPFSAMQSIAELVEKTGVSAPSITRFISKIGYGGFQEFKRQLITELKEGMRSPLDLENRQTPPGEAKFLTSYARRLATVLEDMPKAVSQDQFDAICALVADPGRHIYLLGGRVSNSIATYLAVHLQQIRNRIHHIPDNPDRWPDDILRMRKKDVLILFDFRRYQSNLARLAQVVSKQRQCSIVLITDQWISPIARHSTHIVPLPIDVGTPWDTAIAATAFTEALIVKVSEADWNGTRQRLTAWDELRAGTQNHSNENHARETDET